MGRLEKLEFKALSDEQKDVYQDIIGGPRGLIPAPLEVWLQRPGLAGKAQVLGQYCRYDSSLPPRLSELAILTTAQIWKARYEWLAHVEHARAAGIGEDIIQALRNYEDPKFDKVDEEVVYHFSKVLNIEKRVKDSLFAEARSILGLGGLVDLIGVLGYYSLISMTIKTFEL